MSFKITNCQAEFHYTEGLPCVKIGNTTYDKLGTIFTVCPHWVNVENKKPAAELINFMLFGEKYKVFKVHTLNEELETFSYLQRMFTVRKIEKDAKVLFIYLKDQNQQNSKIVFTFLPTNKVSCVQKFLDN